MDNEEHEIAGSQAELEAALAEIARYRRRARSALAQRERLEDRLEALAILQNRLDALEASTVWRATRPLRRLAEAVPPSGRRTGLRLAKLLWWTATLQLPYRWREWKKLRAMRALQRIESGSAAAPHRADRAPVALIIDYRWPQPDRDSGSIDVMNLVTALLELGFRIVFSAHSDYPRAEADRTGLKQHGVRCIFTGKPLEDFLREEGRTVELCVLTRIFGGGPHLEAVTTFCPRARIVFNTVDLHFIRTEREARLHGDEQVLAFSREVRCREISLAGKADATIVVSTHERDVLAAAVPDAYIVHLPLARAIGAPQTGFAGRRGIGFIAGFAHAPNLDALRFFLADIWPLILREMPDCEFSIVGADLPPETLHGVPGKVRYLGHLPEVAPWFEAIRLTIAPLRFGAGAKGKIASSLAAGVPCVATTVGVEGMGLVDSLNVLTADDAAGFCAHVCELYNNRLLWERLSAGGHAYADAELSLAGWKRQLREMLWTIGAIAEENIACSGAPPQDVLHLVDHPIHREGARQMPSGSCYARA